MRTFEVSWTYTISVQVSAESPDEAFDKAMGVDYNFVDTKNTGAELELCEADSPFIRELEA